jgi:hypothetical protein
MNFSDIKHTITHHLINIPGWHTNRKIVVIESDDWGSIRMPSKEIARQLSEAGMNLKNDPYSLYDTLATGSDLDALFEVLKSVKDKNGRNAIITANTVVANPDFDKIKKSGYRTYYYEPFTQTLARSPLHQNAFVYWKKGMTEGIFHPQFHGREHVNVRKWLNDLQRDHANVRLWFDYGSYGTSYLVDRNQKSHYMTSFDSSSKEDIEFYNNSLIDGLHLFENIFGFRSESFIATTYCWPAEIEYTLKRNGVKFLQGMVAQKIPIDNGEKFKTKKNNFQGTRSKSGLMYLMRNAFFEPAQDAAFDWISDCMNRIRIAFKWHKPATISMHRLNVTGTLNEDNRTRNLKLLQRLLDEITKKWPDVEFMSSDELGHLMIHENS